MHTLSTHKMLLWCLQQRLQDVLGDVFEGPEEELQSKAKQAYEQAYDWYHIRQERNAHGHPFALPTAHALSAAPAVQSPTCVQQQMLLSVLTTAYQSGCMPCLHGADVLVTAALHIAHRLLSAG